MESKYIEDDPSLAAGVYSHPLTYSFDESLPGPDKFRYSFDQGGLKCSELPAKNSQICIVSPTEMTALQHEQPCFAYIDNGCWVDNADGKGKKRRDFALVCGPHIYLCEYAVIPTMTKSKIPAVDAFFSHMKTAFGGIRVLSYLRAMDTLPKSTSDTDLYLLLGDLHLPPVSWFYDKETASNWEVVYDYDGPKWLENIPQFTISSIFRSYYEISSYHRQNGTVPNPIQPLGNPDIFGKAEASLVAFLDRISSMPNDIKDKFHFVQSGDMFELWLGREYQYLPGPENKPVLKSSDSAKTIAGWCLEVMIQNIGVFEAFKRLETSGLKEVRYLSGNHDTYLQETSITQQLGIPNRDLAYAGLNGDIHIEHGHRFDDANYDNVSGSSPIGGPLLANAAYALPQVRSLEDPLRSAFGIAHTSNERDFYLLGASLIFLSQKYDHKAPPFAIFTMGHTHAPLLCRFKLKAELHLYSREYTQ
jgi:hypothetical protein